VDDVGRAINPLILHSQTHGGIAQGVGQALLEESYYEPQSGQPLAASFMDYGMPRADTLPLLATALSEVPAPSTRLGVRSGGEGGTPPALAAVINAIVDALAELGVSQIEMPATPERVWRAIQAARFAATASRDDPEARLGIAVNGTGGLIARTGDETAWCASRACSPPSRKRRTGSSERGCCA
jgi:xanthine dehydrogenase molybdopterin-binding subunit B